MGTYFRDNYSQAAFPVDIAGGGGLRRAQLGAIHATAAHFTLQERPAIIVLPTGTGKTAVLMLAPYVLQAERVLIITQSRFVRDQINQDFKTLHTLKQAGVFPSAVHPPQVYENKGRIRSTQAWQELAQYDAVVSLPNGASPAYTDVPPPPADLFDLVLIDEAHHSPAVTWQQLITAFPQAHSVLFTATPFRRDGKEIKGKYIYTYPIQRAFEDQIFGEMSYLPVTPSPGVAPDVALAQETAHIFNADTAAGFRHAIMVRADSRPRANQLAAIYSQHTSLKLEILHSGLSQRTTEKTVQRLRAGEIHGVICVNMLGEGFDLPHLKIAALHAPHRSLAVTLQFFGRFARVNAQQLGEAKFLAVQSELEGGIAELYQENEAWGKKIRILGQARIGEEIATREFLDDFHPIADAQIEASFEDLSLHSFNLLNHVKVYQVYGKVNLDTNPQLDGFATVKVWINESEMTTVFLVREEIRPKWTQAESLARVEYHLIVVHYDQQANLLFICATYREETVYQEIAAAFIDGTPQPLSLSRINRVLRSISDLELFNVGMRNRATGTVVETYRQLAGAAVHGAIEKEDGLLYHRGHIFGRGQTAHGVTTIGLSSQSKIWRLEHTKIPGLVNWCRSLARDIENPAPFTTGIALDHLDAGREITALPNEAVIAADWQDNIYRNPPLVHFVDARGVEQIASLLEFDLHVESQIASDGTIRLELVNHEARTRLHFALSPYPRVHYADEQQPKWHVARGYRRQDLIAYLNANTLRFHLADGSLLEGCQLFEALTEGRHFDADILMHPVDWQSASVDITQEFGASIAPLISIHDWLRTELLSTAAPIVFYDHRSGECADYVVVDIDAEGLPIVKLYHCKGSGEAAPGDRLEDLYEVCGQAIKSTQWRSKKRLITKVRDRVRGGSIFCRGDLNTFLALIEADVRHELPLEVYIVQPGVARSRLSDKLAVLLATANHGLTAAGCQRLQVICSG